MRRSKLLSGFALPVVAALLVSCGGGSGDGGETDTSFRYLLMPRRLLS